MRPHYATRNLNTITIESGSDPKTSSDFLYELKGAQKAGFEEIEVNLSEIKSAPLFPNVAVPISALIDSANTSQSVKIIPAVKDEYIDNIGLFNPYSVNDKLAYQHNVFNKVWKFKTSEETFRLTREFIDELYKSTAVQAEGVLAALEWCLGEVLENAILHSDAESGYAMGQIHPSNRHIAFSIVDLGKGIFNSLLLSENYSPATPVDAITLAMQEGVTRNKQTNQGNGLWGLQNILKSNKGILAIISGGGGLTIKNNSMSSFQSQRFGFKGGGTIIDFQIDLDMPIALGDILGGYIPKPHVLLNVEDDRGDITYDLKDQKEGFGTREAGARIRTEIINMRSQTSGKVFLNFESISVITSSFADELVGKLYVELGPLGFGSSIQLQNMNQAVEAIINRAIVQRMTTHEEMRKHKTE